MTDLYLSRARLAPGHDRLGPILFPSDQAQRGAVSHRLVWTLFPEDLTERPFLYRETAPAHQGTRTGQGEFLILSNLLPENKMGLFDLETRVFAPSLAAGQRLRFSLRANPTVHMSEIVDGRRKTRRHDVVMRALYDLPKGQARREARPEAIRKAGLDWLARQGDVAGFRLPGSESEAIVVDGYEQFDADPEYRRGVRAGRRPVHSRIDYEGVLEVLDPQLFLSRVATGFGRARAFGLGLMLIRRV